MVCANVVELVDAGIKQSDIAVITPYNLQVRNPVSTSVIAIFLLSYFFNPNYMHLDSERKIRI